MFPQLCVQTRERLFQKADCGSIHKLLKTEKHDVRLFRKVWIEKPAASPRNGLSYLRFTRIAETKAPAPPRSASTTVGFSGESVHPVCACKGTATRIIATSTNTATDFFIIVSSCNPSQAPWSPSHSSNATRIDIYGAVAIILFFTADTRGVTTGVPAPTNSSTLWLPAAATQMSPEPSTAMPYGRESTPAAV